MIISVIPVILGEGIRLFPDKPKETKQVLSGSNSFPTGIANLTFEKVLESTENDWH
jgi:dihydrofolate reductase